MILSMTGYGKAESNAHNKKFTVEIKSLNSKQIDMNVRMPSSYRDKELVIRKFLSSALGRGKIDCSLFVEHTGIEKTANINARYEPIFRFGIYVYNIIDCHTIGMTSNKKTSSFSSFSRCF